MNQGQAQESIKKVNTDLSDLNPSALITLFEIDISDIAFSKGIITSLDNANENEWLFRFHNNIPYLGQNIFWRGKSYNALPIRAEGFEISARGTLPTPRLQISTNEESIPTLSVLKVQLAKLGDLIGSKVTRIRTFYKYLDPINFQDGNPDADSNAELPRDIFFIDRKANESKNSIEYELASILDVEGIQLPARMVLANRCTAQYRGEGCLYEANENRVIAVHGATAKLPSLAPPVATEQGDLISTLLPVALAKRGKWERNITYTIGNYVYIEKDGIKYYFVAKATIPQNQAPPDGRYWIADACSKLVENGCKHRWGSNSLGVSAPGRLNGNPHNNCLPFMAFPAVNKVS